MWTRRQFGTSALALAGFSAPQRIPVIGVTTYSFRELSLTQTIQAIAALKLSAVEFWEGHAQPPKAAEESWKNYASRMKEWRRSVSPDHFAAIQAQFAGIGLQPFAFTHAFQADDTDQDIDNAFLFAKALQVKSIFSSNSTDVVKRVDRFAKKHQLLVAVHNHSLLKPGEMTRPEDFENALRGTTNIRINLDIGHFTAAGFDPVDYLQRHHDQVLGIHIKDRKKDQGPNTPFGQGDTPIAGVMRLLRDQRLSIPALVEYEYQGAGSATEVRRCLDYLRQTLS